MKRVKLTVKFDTVVPDHMAKKLIEGVGGKRDQILLVEFAFQNAGTEFEIEGEVIEDKHVERLY